MKSKIEYWHECRHCSGQNKFKKIKLLNREIKIEIQVLENEIKNEIQGKTKYWYEW